MQFVLGDLVAFFDVSGVKVFRGLSAEAWDAHDRLITLAHTVERGLA